jgi:hypothetical protein
MISVSRQQALATAERLLNTEEILAAVPAGGFLNGPSSAAPEVWRHRSSSGRRTCLTPTHNGP